MITIKYKGKIVDIKDIEINWVEYNIHSDNGFIERIGDIEDYAHSKYSEGYDEGFENGYDEGTYPYVRVEEADLISYSDDKEVELTPAERELNIIKKV